MLGKMITRPDEPPSPCVAYIPAEGRPMRNKHTLINKVVSDRNSLKILKEQALVISRE